MIIAIIPAKERSRRLPNKNLLTINGESLIEIAAQYAKKSEKVARVYVSTDSISIAEHAKQIGVDVIMRGSDLGGETPVTEVYKHAFKEIDDERITHVVGLQPDNPDRKTDLDEAIKCAISNRIDNLFTVDRNGKRTGSLCILSLNAIRSIPWVYSCAIRDDCTNIHSAFDLAMAKKNLSENADVITVRGKRIGRDEPTIIIAEAACNHMCDMDLARRMIDVAAEAGVDAIKFQTYKAEKLVTRNAVAFWGEEQVSQLDYYKRLDRFGKQEYGELFSHAQDKGIIAFSSPFDAESAEMLAELDMPMFKIASCEIPNLTSLKHVASFGKPIILSTGASTLGEIDKAIETIFLQGNFQLMLLACTLSYPTKNSDANLLRIKTLIRRYPGMIIGLSDHTEPDDHMVIPSIGVALGARIIEKHYTLDRSMTGSGHFFAMSPDDLKKMVNNIRLTERLMGSGTLGVTKCEENAWRSARRSIVAETDIKAGEKITREMVGFKRPGDGLAPNMIKDVINKRAKQDLQPDEKICLEMLE